MNPNYIYLVVAVFAVASISVGEAAKNNIADTKGKFIMCPKNLLTFRKRIRRPLVYWFSGIYYYADSGLKNWTDARAFCVEYGLHLLIITTNDQWNLLAAAFNTTAFSGNHWTALRDAYLPRQFSWDNLGTEPSSDIGMVWGNSDGNGNGEYQTCASFFASSIANTAIYINPCSSYFKVLCET